MQDLGREQQPYAGLLRLKEGQFYMKLCKKIHKGLRASVVHHKSFVPMQCKQLAEGRDMLVNKH